MLQQSKEAKKLSKLIKKKSNQNKNNCKKESISKILHKIDLTNIASFPKSNKQQPREISNQFGNNKILQLKLKRFEMKDLKNTNLILKPTEIRNNRIINSVDSNNNSINYAPKNTHQLTKDSGWSLKDQTPIIKNCSVRLTRLDYEEYKNKFEKLKMNVSSCLKLKFLWNKNN